MKYFHVADPSYTLGDDLWAREEQESRGIETPWKWVDAEPGFDRDVICLFRDLAEAHEFIATFLPGGILLGIDIPDEAIEYREIRMTTVDEGYDAVVGRIPAAYITVVS